IAVARARRPRRGEAVVGGLVAGIGTLRAARTGITRVRAGAAAAGIGAIAEEPVVARRRVVRMRAGAAAVALVVRAHVAVAGARRAGRIEAVVGGLVAAMGTLRAARAGIAGMDRTAAAAARVGTVAEAPVAARRGVVGMRAGAGGVAVVVRALVPGGGAGGACRSEAVVGGLIAGGRAFRAAGTGVARVRAGPAAAGVGAVAEEPVI